MSKETEQRFPRPLSSACVDPLPSGLNHMVYKGLNRDTAWYSILGEEWPAVRAVLQDWLDDVNFDARGIAKRSLGAMMTAGSPHS